MGFHGPPTPAGQGLCGFNREWSLVVKQNVKTLATPYVAKLNPEYRFYQPTLHQFNSVTQEVAKLLTFYFTTRKHSLSNHHYPGLAGVGGPWNLISLYLPYFKGLRGRYVHVIAYSFIRLLDSRGVRICDISEYHAFIITWRCLLEKPFLIS